MRCAGTQCLQLHDTLPLPLRQEGIHNDGCPHCIWCICGHRCTGSHFFGICASKSGSCSMNLSSCWQTTVWLQLLLCQYQLIVACCNLFSCNGAVVLWVGWHITIIVEITVIVIVNRHWHLDAFNGLITIIILLGVMFGICSCMTRQFKSAVAQGLCQRSCARSDISCVGNVTSLLLFFPTKANLWYKVWSLWWSWSQMWVSSCGTLGFQD